MQRPKAILNRNSTNIETKLLTILQAVKQFVDIVNGVGSNITRKNVSTTTAIKFLFARKFDVQRAITLYEQHEQIRHRECLYNLNPISDHLQTELETGKFTILVSIN